MRLSDRETRQMLREALDTYQDDRKTIAAPPPTSSRPVSDPLQSNNVQSAVKDLQRFFQTTILSSLTKTKSPEVAKKIASEASEKLMSKISSDIKEVWNEFTKN